MRAIIKSQPKPGFEFVDDYPQPDPGTTDVVVKVHSASICGTDRELYDWSASGQAFGSTLPVVQGHEGSGTVVAVGTGVSGFNVGDRVAFESHVVCGSCRECRSNRAEFCPRTKILGMHLDGLFAEYAAIPAHACYPLPDTIDLECGALMESAGVAAHAMQRTDFRVAGSNVLVSGLGPVGLAIGMMARRLGAKHVFGIEPNEYRRSFAEDFGITTLAPGDQSPKTMFDVDGFDVSFEASGARGTLPTLLENASTDSIVMAIAHPGAEVPVEVSKHINKRGVVLQGIFGRKIWESWELLADLQKEQVIDLKEFITHRVKLEDYDNAMDLLHGDACKVLFQPAL
ncbi:zinc-dependent alcohol dehydrogenase [Corynebacterium glyciniphilum]|uniref:zinc-dependent alcohol dehydrogenase n=1 Tax=Corynebacterium glyciniphilum TaxID=1404244 RepID=UPI003D9FC3B1